MVKVIIHKYSITYFMVRIRKLYVTELQIQI
jgi:hypothetical protein